ncbi:MAG: carboxypeptidase-like regulatory domain-containing protein, partial [Longimicrobiales bacterium]
MGSVIDGSSAAPLAGAVFALSNGKSAVTDASGQFVIEDVTAGSYAPVLSATGYESQQYSLSVPAGGTANIGTLKLFRSTQTTAPDTVTLIATVLDSVTNQAVNGAQLTIPAQSLSITSDAQGQATLSGVSGLSFQMEVNAAGYAPQVLNVTVSGYGTVATTLKLAPQVEASDKTILRGTVTDAESGAPVNGAAVQVVGTALSVNADANGGYELNDVPALNFELRFTALGYDGKGLTVQLPAKGTYRIDASLDPSAAETTSGFQVLNVAALDSGKGAFELQRFEAQIGYDGAEVEEALVLGQILDVNGRNVGTISPYAPGTQVPQAGFTFAPGEIKTLQLGWDPAQLPPAVYALQLTVVKPGTINSAVPGGTVLAERSAYTQVSATHAMAGTLSFDPPAAQAGSSTPVKLAALVVNSGNVSLTNQPLTLTIK